MSYLASLKWLSAHPATHRNRIRTWSRWAYWQVRQRLTRCPKIMSFVEGTQLAIHPHEGLTGYWYVILPDYDELMFLQRFLCSDDVFYDVGANAGAFSVLAAGRRAVVVAFEPVPQSFQRLRENVNLNRELGPIIALNLALGSASGHLRMTTGFGTGNHALRPGEGIPSVEVEVVTLDEVIREQPAPTFIKVDVEGHELEVLKGASETLASEHLEGLLLETFRPHNWQMPKLREIERILQVERFLPYSYNADRNEIIALKKPNEGENNTFYFRSPENVSRRLLANVSKVPSMS